MTQDSNPPPSAIQRVPVGRTMRAAYAAVFTSLGLLVKAAVLPFLLSLMVLALSFMANANAFLSFVLVVVGFVPYTLFGVAWHRLTLLGPTAGAPVAFPSWQRRHWRFLGYVIAVTGVLYAFIVSFFAIGLGAGGEVGETLRITNWISVLVTLAAIIGIPYVLMRLAFVFPAVAVDEEYTVANSWAHTRGQGFRLMGALFVTALPIMVAIWAVGSALGVLLLPEIAANTQESGMSPEEALRQALQDNTWAFSLAQLVLAVLNYILAALMVSVVSIAFRLCTGWVPAAHSIEDHSGVGS